VRWVSTRSINLKPEALAFVERADKVAAADALAGLREAKTSAAPRFEVAPLLWLPHFEAADLV
jgi:hypothetical protein